MIRGATPLTVRNDEFVSKPGRPQVTTLLIEEKSYKRLEPEIKAISPELKALLIGADGSLSMDNQKVEGSNIKPDIAWLNIEILFSGIIEKFVKLVLETGTVQWLQTFMAGLDFPFYREMLGKGIRITRSNAQAVAIAEYVLSNVLVQYQGVFERRKHQTAHAWRITGFREIWRTKWLIVGFGNIGQEIAKRVRAFEAEVVGVRRSSADHPLADAMITLDRVSEYLPQADVVVLACALNQETRELANQAFFQKMKKESTLVNIARGKLVNQKDMIEALRAGRPARAILDVFDPEPLEPDSPLWDMDNVIITPHSSNAGNGTHPRGDRLFLENLSRFLEGRPLLHETYPESL
jgi:phosphoglycerate dehydrogenase-like enzyme